MEVSKLKFYSVGIVAANKPLNSKDIEVTPVEDMPMLNGEITDTATQYTAEGKGRDGDAFTEEITTTTSIKATWLPISNSNRITAPDVRRGETVVIYRFGDSNKYFWNTLINDAKLRRLETVIYAFSDNPTEGADDTADSTYYFEVSTHNGYVHLHTAKSNNEPFAYDIQVNTKDGSITVMDDVGNFFLIDSTNTKMVLRNADNTFISLNKRNMALNAEENIDITCKNLTGKIGNATSITSETNTIKGSSNTMTGSTNTVNGPTNINGATAIDGGFTTGGGDAVMTGNYTLIGNSSVQGVLTATKLVSQSNIDAPNV